MPTRDEIVDEVLSLPPDDRIFVAHAIDQSLTKDGFATQEIAAAWMQEIERRLTAYDRGELQAVPSGVAIEKMRERLLNFRAAKASS